MLGIVRRVDDLGRVVIPKEFRKVTGIQEGDPVEISIDTTTNSICLRKYPGDIVATRIDDLIRLIDNKCIGSESQEVIDELKKIKITVQNSNNFI